MRTGWIGLRYAAITLGLTLGLPVTAAPMHARPPAETAIQPAMDGIFAAFATHPLVGLGDDHGLAQGMDFYAALVRDPRFARQVGNVVVEFGGAARQDIVDRYVAGDAVPYDALRRVWTDTIGWIPTAGYLGFAKFLAAVRASNKALPRGKRIRVWLGEPPIDWTAPSGEDLMAAMNARDSHPAGIIGDQILAKGKKALVIYGSLHFAGGGWLGGRIAAAHPGTMFVILPYSGIHRPAACAPLLARAAALWPVPVLATVDPVMRDCATLGGQTVVAGDAVLFYGPPERLAKGPWLPDYLLDAEYRREMARRARIGGPPLVRFPRGFSLRKADYAVDLDAPGFAERVDMMFAAQDRNGDGVVTADEYVDPIP